MLVFRNFSEDMVSHLYLSQEKKHIGKMNSHIDNWTKIFEQNYCPSTAVELSNKLRQRYSGLLSIEIQVPNRDLRTQWKKLIAPGLALYRTLLADGKKDQQAVLDEVEDLFEASFFITERKMLTLLNKLPDPFPVVRLGLRRMTKNKYLPGASEVIEDNNTCFAINTYRCFILDTLTQHGTPELTSLFCKTDDWLAAEVPKVKWSRTITLAGGGGLCDFRWSRQEDDH